MARIPAACEVSAGSHPCFVGEVSGSERLSNLPQVTEQVRGQGGLLGLSVPALGSRGRAQGLLQFLGLPGAWKLSLLPPPLALWWPRGPWPLGMRQGKWGRQGAPHMGTRNPGRVSQFSALWRLCPASAQQLPQSASKGAESS